MIITRIRSLYNAQPFSPFIMHLADGRKIRVPHPEFIAAAPSGRTVTVYQADDTSSIVDLALVTDLEIEDPRKKRGNR